MTIPDQPAGTREARRRYDWIAERLRGGRAHPTLGFHPDRGDVDWWRAGEARFAKLIDAFAIAPHHRVIDYGCGTLRLGGHFMRRLDRGAYFGLDVAQDLISMGRELVGEDTIAEKAPHLATIDEASLLAAERFAADFVFSEAVSYHVVPDELDFYHAALKRLTHKPGGTLFFNVRLSDTEYEYVQGCWTRPLSAYRDGLAPLEFVKEHFVQIGAAGGKRAGVIRSTLEFRRV